MKSEELFKLIGELDENLVYEAGLPAEKPAARRRATAYKWVALAAAAACVCLAVGIAAPKLLRKNAPTESVTTVAQVESAKKAADEESPETVSVGEPQIEPGNSIVAETETQTSEAYNPVATNSPVIVGAEGRKEQSVTQPGGEMQPTTNDPEATEPDIAAAPGVIPPGDPNKVKSIISRYGDMSGAIPDMAVNNGTVEFSDNLKTALAECGNAVTYRVLVEVFKDGVQVPIGPELIENEITQFTKAGYTVALETHSDENSSTTYFTLHATANQLDEFLTPDSCGFMVMLYDEYFGVQEQPETSNGLVTVYKMN